MHAFAIISNSEQVLEKERNKLLQKFEVGLFDRIVIGLPESQTIKAVRDAQRLLKFQALTGKFQALIVLRLEKFTIASQQSLLKTTEEPPKNTIVIIESQNQDLILPTILSRTQVIYRPESGILTKDEERETTSFWLKTLRTKEVGERLNLSSELLSKGANRESLVVWLDKQIIFFHGRLLKKVGQMSQKNGLSLQNINKIIRLLLFAKKYTLGNINTKLLFDHLFITLPSL